MFVEVFARFQAPVSWSKSKRATANGLLKRTKPDGDNVLKSLDALWPEDSALGDLYINRTWWPVNETMIRITFNPEVKP